MQRIEAIVEWQQCVTPECDDRCLLGLGQGRRVRGLRPGLQILDRRPLSSLGNRLGVDPELSGSASRAKLAIAVLVLGLRTWSWRARDELFPYNFLPFQ